LYPCNKIYVFGDFILSTFKTKIPKKRKIKVNKEKIDVYPLSYYKYQSNIGENVNIHIGGFSGTGYSQRGEAGKTSVYLLLGSGTIKPIVTPMGGAGVSFSNGNIYPLDMNFGQFMAEILENGYR
jgi:hypothetical protein